MSDTTIKGRGDVCRHEDMRSGSHHNSVICILPYGHDGLHLYRYNSGQIRQWTDNYLTQVATPAGVEKPLFGVVHPVSFAPFGLFATVRDAEAFAWRWRLEHPGGVGIAVTGHMMED